MAFGYVQRVATQRRRGINGDRSRRGFYSGTALSNGSVMVSAEQPIYFYTLTADQSRPTRYPITAYYDFELTYPRGFGSGQGPNGASHTIVERVPGEVWVAMYASDFRVARLDSPTPAGFNFTNIRQTWRPKAVATDGTSIWWGGNNGNDYGFTTEILGVWVKVASDGTGAVFTDVFNQIPLCADYYGGTLYCASGGEGVVGADTTPRFRALNPATMATTWSVPMAGTRPLSMCRSDNKYYVITHEISDTLIRINQIDINTQTWDWYTVLTAKAWGRIRNSLVEWQGELWTIGDDALYTVDVAGQTLQKRKHLDLLNKPSFLCATAHHLVFGAGPELFRFR